LALASDRDHAIDGALELLWRVASPVVVFRPTEEEGGAFEMRARSTTGTRFRVPGIEAVEVTVTNRPVVRAAERDRRPPDYVGARVE
jgi:hypothetical protein